MCGIEHTEHGSSTEVTPSSACRRLMYSAVASLQSSAQHYDGWLIRLWLARGMGPVEAVAGIGGRLDALADLVQHGGRVICPIGVGLRW